MLGQALFQDHVVLDRVHLPVGIGLRSFFRARYQLGVTFIPPRLPSVLCHVTPSPTGNSQNDCFFPVPAGLFVSDFSFNSSQLQQSLIWWNVTTGVTMPQPFALYHNMNTQLLSCVQLFEAPCAITHQAPLSLEFSRQAYWSGLPFPPPGILPDSSQGLN